MNDRTFYPHLLRNHIKKLPFQAILYVLFYHRARLILKSIILNQGEYEKGRDKKDSELSEEI